MSRRRFVFAFAFVATLFAVLGTWAVAAWDVTFPEADTEICEHCPVEAEGTGMGAANQNLTLRVYVQGNPEGIGAGTYDGILGSWMGTVEAPAEPNKWPAPSMANLKVWDDDDDDESTPELCGQEFFFIP